MRTFLFSLILGFCCLCGTVLAQESHDGPYVTRRGGRTTIMTMSNGKVIKKHYGTGKRLKVTVSFPEHPDWNFSLKLKDTLLQEASIYAQPEKLFFLSDIEGEFSAFRSLLLAGSVIDSAYNWTFGNGHLVMCGDLFDRGSYVPETLWLMYKLEQDAAKAGGYVHVILGNHDIMNLSGDLRYLQPKYNRTAAMLSLDYPDLYGPDMELGRWLRTKNTIEKIGDNLCLHGGVSPQVNALHMPLLQINSLCRPYYDKAPRMDGVGDPVADVFFTGETSLFWYRGYFEEPRAGEAQVNQTLDLYDVQRIVVGHTIVPGNISFRYGRKVLALDVDHHEGDHQAVLYQNKRWYKVNDKGEINAF